MEVNLHMDPIIKATLCPTVRLPQGSLMEKAHSQVTNPALYTQHKM